MDSKGNPFSFALTSLANGDGGSYGSYYSLPALGDERIDKLPYTVLALLESAISNCDGFQITKDDVEKIMDWEKTSDEQVEIPFKPARVILQDFTGVPVLVDFASMRDAVSRLDDDPDKINPMVPADLVIDHSVTADVVRSESAVQANMELALADRAEVSIIEAYLRANKMFVDHDEPQIEHTYSSYLELDLRNVEPCVSGPKSFDSKLYNCRPHDRVPLKDMKTDWHACLDNKVGFKTVKLA
ncbi:hypothetical protein C2845_PM09G10850 [Panicum miliaceum]|uniref:Aconitase/3-isopropylmalate dehydratase large subunit alpha/beta/alpha domain-containing protein n=1 Tax=Panicum miliaceum TaxID=4540 RepID=A0A3L6RYX4_PANMI|nr:hypothetical protein C2845_PM09G10850 [Panicum miliaceum]